MSEDDINKSSERNNASLDDHDDEKTILSATDQYVNIPITKRDEETATEMTVDDRREGNEGVQDQMETNSVTGWIGLALSVLSFFIFPIMFGIVGVVLGFIARTRSAIWLGNTAIAIGVLSLVIRIIVRPFIF